MNYDDQSTLLNIYLVSFNPHSHPEEKVVFTPST